MSKQQAQKQEDEQDAAYQLRQTWHMRWYLAKVLFVCTLVVIGASVGSVVAFCVTKNALSFSPLPLSMPLTYVWYRFTKYLFPLSENDLEMERIRSGAVGKAKRERVAQSETGECAAPDAVEPGEDSNANIK